MSTIDLTGDAWERDVIESSERNHQGLVEFTANSLPNPATLGPGVPVIVDGSITVSNGHSYSFQKSRTHMLTKNVIGRLKTYTTTALSTLTFAFELQCDSDCFQIGLPNIHTSAVTGISANISVSNFVSKDNSPSMVAPSTGVFVPVTWGGAATATLPARAGAELPAFTFSDPIYLSTIARLDGVQKPWVLIRLEVPSGTVISIPYNAVWNLELGTSGMPKVMYQSFAVGGVTTPGAITPSYSMEHTNIMIPAIRYSSSKPAIQLMSVGDSTTQGLASNSAKSAPTDHGAVARAGYLKSTPQLPVECFNSSIHGQLPKVYAETINQHFSIVKPTHVFYSPYSINSVSTVLTDAIIKNNNGALCRFIENLAGRVNGVAILGGLPCNAAWKDLGATDSLRIAYNSYLKSLKVGFAYVGGYVDAYSGVVDGDGQTQIATGLSSDNVHPNEDGYMVLAAAVLPYIQ